MKDLILHKCGLFFCFLRKDGIRVTPKLNNLNHEIERKKSASS